MYGTILFTFVMNGRDKQKNGFLGNRDGGWIHWKDSQQRHNSSEPKEDFHSHRDEWKFGNGWICWGCQSGVYVRAFGRQKSPGGWLARRKCFLEAQIFAGVGKNGKLKEL
jgi:hypothetical protein